ncbi:hypothetical protein PMAYCL1PPCAC_19198, partial [Pristionchus mayeri]
LLPDSSRFVCKLGKWESENGNSLADSTRVNCLPITTTVETTIASTTVIDSTTEVPTTVATTETSRIIADSAPSSAGQTSGKAGAFVLIGFSVLLLLLLLVFLGLGLSGKGWIHTIILSKLRGRKGERKSSKDGGS